MQKAHEVRLKMEEDRDSKKEWNELNGMSRAELEAEEALTLAGDEDEGRADEAAEGGGRKAAPGNAFEGYA